MHIWKKPLHVLEPVCSSVHLETPVHVIVPVCSSVHLETSVHDVQHYVIKFVSDLRHVGGFLRVLRFSPINTTERHDIAEILLKVALNII